MSESWADGQTLGSRTTVRDVLVDAEWRLQRAGVPSPAVDAAEIVALVLQVPRTRLFLLDDISDDQKVRIEQLLALRLSRVPLQHIMGTAAFRHLELEVGPGVFIPRPETELVTEAALRALLGSDSRVAVDLCSGSGAIAIALATECPGSQVHAIELDDEAVVWTRRNVAAHAEQLRAVASVVTVHHADAMSVADDGGALERLRGTVAVVASNPPYIPSSMVPREPEVRDHEPPVALYGGIDGLDVVRGVVRTAALLLRPGGLVVIEHADVQGPGAGGVPSVVESLVADEEMSRASGGVAGGPAFEAVVDRIDLNGLPRFTIAHRIGTR